MRRNGCRILPVSAVAASAGQRLLGGPLLICGWSFNDGAATQGLSATGTVNTPGAGATITTIALPSGDYTVQWTVELQGTPGAADINNVGLYLGASLEATSVNLGADGNYAQAPADISVQGGPLTLTAKAIGAATAGAIYIVNFTIIPTGQSMATIFNGGMAAGFVGIAQGGVDTQWFDDEGIAIDTDISVQTNTGVISGVIYYRTERDTERERTAVKREG